MLTTTDILCGVLLPLILSGVILALARLVQRGGHWSGPLAIGIAFTAAFGCLQGSSHLFPPHSAIPWLFYLGLLLTIAGLLDAVVRLPIWLRPFLIFIATMAGGFLLLRFNFDNHTWDRLHGVLWLAGIAIVATLWWACFETTAADGGILMPLAAMMISGIAGLVIMLVADQSIGQALGALAIAFAATIPVVAWFKDISLARGTSMLIAGLGICGLAGAYFVSDVPMIDLSLVGIAPVLLVVSRWFPPPRHQ